MSAAQHPILDLLWNFVMRLFLITHNLQPKSCVQMTIKDESLYDGLWNQSMSVLCWFSRLLYYSS